MPPSSRQILLEKGQFLFLQGAPSDSFFVLKKGTLEVLINEGSDLPDEELVRQAGRRVRILNQPNSPIGEIGTLVDSPRSASIRALAPSELIWVAGGRRALVEWVKTNLAAGLLVSRSLAERVVETHVRWNNVEWLHAAMRAYLENFTILYAIFNNRALPPETAKGRLVAEGREFLAALDQATPPSLQDVERNVPPRRETLMDVPFLDTESAHFFSTILNRPDNELEWLISSSSPPHPLLFMTSRLADLLPRLTKQLHAAMLLTEEVIKRFYGKDGITRAFIEMAPLMNEEQWAALRPLIEKLTVIAETHIEEIQKIWGDTFPMLHELQRDLDLSKDVLANRSAALDKEESPAADEPSPGAEPASPSPVVEGPRFDLSAAFELVRPDQLEKDMIDLCLGRREAEAKAVYAAYWRLYHRVWRIARDRGIPELIAFLRFGIAQPGKVAPPDTAFDFSPQVSGPILFADQWLNRIYKGESPPSRNDLGQSYEEVLAGMKQTRFAPEESDPKMDFVRYEIDQMMSRAARAFSAGRGEQATLRRTPEEVEALKETMLTPARVAEGLVRLLRLDFTPFVRDVRVLLEERSEFLPKDILPFMVILPAAGDRAVSWQEFEGRSKDTAGRILFPLVSETEIFELVVATVAKHRWDLAKAVAGAEWMNPADGGLTGRYYDYVTFFRKNPELSDEQKQKMTDIFASVGMDADKFAIEYALWIKYESQGIQRLNRVARRIFAEFCPFDIETRKRLIRQPAFTEILRKDSNKRLKRKQELERRIYKLERNGVTIGNVFEMAMKIYQEIPD